MGVRKPPACDCGGKLRVKRSRVRDPKWQCQTCGKVFTAAQCTTLALLQENGLGEPAEDLGPVDESSTGPTQHGPGG